MITRNHRKQQKDAYKKGLDENDPFDQVILELAQKGILDVSAVKIHEGQPTSEAREYSKKMLTTRGKNVSQ